MHEQYHIVDSLVKIPPFQLHEIKSDNLKEFKKSIEDSNALIICTPEYLQNIPSALKNALEWCYKSNEFADKKVLLIVYTPKHPRGEKAMKSLEWSINALHAKPVGTMIIHHDDIAFDDHGNLLYNNIDDMLKAAIELLIQ